MKTKILDKHNQNPMLALSPSLGITNITDNVNFYQYLGYLLLKKSTPLELLTQLILTFTLIL